MKKFVLKTSIFSILILTFLVSTNYLGDSANLFKSSYEKKISKIILSGHNATNISNYDERKFQREIVGHLDDRPDIVVMGSSRTMLIKSTFFKDKKFFNNSVSAASIEDLIGVFQLYKAKNLYPKKIFIGIDPWIFNKNNGKVHWKSLKREYNNFITGKVVKETKESILNDKTKQLFSFSYFQASLDKLPDVLEEKLDSTARSLDPVATNEINNTGNTKLVDGSLSYRKEYRDATKRQILIKAHQYIKVKLYALEEFEEISPKVVTEFNKLCEEILENNVDLVFFLAPYHPLVYQKIENEYQIVLEVENMILQYAKEHNIEVLSSYDPLKSNLTEDDFYDGMHSKENTIKKLMKVKDDNNPYIPISDW
ncbi:DUF1574 family protein [Zobellia uliginosa]|uniref:DUF1574 family protein n=1 Tax=Zobellia uliginosa TaxID=143224 RepID=UPI001C07E980|nr:DUF1574 family protein [Zobellia uliginosa]MBU2946659.1 DUF1574 family protein [Zobellia uliginosa]